MSMFKGKRKFMGLESKPIIPELPRSFAFMGSFISIVRIPKGYGVQIDGEWMKCYAGDIIVCLTVGQASDAAKYHLLSGG